MMDRLTTRAKDQHGRETHSVWYNPYAVDGAGCIFPSSDKEKRVLEKLASYEDTGLTPEEISKWAGVVRFFEDADISNLIDLAEADRDGRLIVLPCKVGDTVWFNTYKNSATKCVGIQPHIIKCLNVYFLTDGADIPEWDIGKTVFLTREEAEAALEAKE